MSVESPAGLVRDDSPPSATDQRVGSRRPRKGAMNHTLGARTTTGKVLTIVALIALLAFTLLPVFMMISTAFDARSEDGSRSLIPTELTLDHFRFVLDEGGFLTYMRNSLIVGVGTVLISGALALLAAVAVSRFAFRLRTSVLVMVLVVQMVPLEALVIPMFIQARHLGLLNQLFGLTLVYVAFSLPFAIWMLRGFVAAIPIDIEEAAYVDGASWGRMFWSVLLPLVGPGLVATSIFAFITAWNEFIFATTFMNDDSKKTAAAGLRDFFGRFGDNDWGAVMAGSTLITVPVMIFFILVQRRISEGLVSGAVKG
ncbi:carbohydrate ABC transporter permease [Solicola gregarius]|uniref:Carbohydrate ABC transporter permease n=1 Tax=Solicola gregarius TaxID=2908642 RepID=A0AA46YJX9_9ACTN|nr:carbohydrate ABC transporter permease [Solicola gregarius]UYM03463.1 carbohydrate ABC transporter permease [Solicola gregarius]